MNPRCSTAKLNKMGISFTICIFDSQIPLILRLFTLAVRPLGSGIEPRSAPGPCAQPSPFPTIHSFSIQAMERTLLYVNGTTIFKQQTLLLNVKQEADCWLKKKKREQKTHPCASVELKWSRWTEWTKRAQKELVKETYKGKIPLPSSCELLQRSRRKHPGLDITNQNGLYTAQNRLCSRWQKPPRITPSLATACSLHCHLAKDAEKVSAAVPSDWSGWDHSVHPPHFTHKKKGHLLQQKSISDGQTTSEIYSPTPFCCQPHTQIVQALFYLSFFFLKFSCWPSNSYTWVDSFLASVNYLLEMKIYVMILLQQSSKSVKEVNLAVS